MYKSKMKVIVNGREVELVTIGECARTLKKSVETIRAWERQKVIPQPMYKSKKIRLYHPKEVEAMKKVLRKVGKHARKDRIQKEMWTALKEVRKEILNEQETNSQETQAQNGEV